MTKQKELYSSPKTEVLVVRFEENILSNPNSVRGNSASSGYGNGTGTTYDLGEI